VSGVFTGAYAVKHFNQQPMPIWVADYVLAGYGTGAVMAVPAHDERDHRFAKQYKLPIIQVIEGAVNIEEEAFTAKDARVINSDFLNGLQSRKAIEKAISYSEENGFGKAKINFRLRDAIFGRQRYWGEPIPIYYKDGVPQKVAENELPVQLPEIDEYLPTEDGDPPLGRASEWNHEGNPFELSTMPGWAGSSWYFFRYMDPHNTKSFASEEALAYWKNVDFYIGGAEHATGHLLYARFWTKFLYDLGYVPVEEFAQKLINQGMIQGRSNFVYRIQGTNQYVSHGLKNEYEVQKLHVDVNIVRDDILDIAAFKASRPDAKDAEFILEDGKYICGWEVEKMSKSKYNVVNPDELIHQYGADTLRMYEMFLGPIEQSKP
jgi:leucyl-tRNA synthetase